MIVGLMIDEKGARQRLDENTVGKYRFLHRAFHSNIDVNVRGLEIAVDVRHEIVHHFPRPDPTRVPEWFEAFQRSGFLVTSKGPGDFDFSQKLESYSLAYWVFASVDANVRALLAGSSIGIAQMRYEGDSHNFGLYRSYCHPIDLPKFDISRVQER